MKTIAIILIALAAILFGGANLAQAETHPVPVTPVVTNDPGQLVGYGLYGAGVGALTGAAVGTLSGFIAGCLLIVTCPVLGPVGAIGGLVAGTAIGAVGGAALAVHEAQTYQP